MATVAVTGVATTLGQALLDRLDGDPSIDRIVGIDRRWPAAPPTKLDMRLTAPDADLAGVVAVLAEADALVNLAAATPAGGASAGRAAGVAAQTATLLAAVDPSRLRVLVQLSSAMAYGALPDNPVPLDETAPLRADPRFPPGDEPVRGERLADEFATAHPQVRVVTLRPAPLLGPGHETPLRRHLESPLLTAVADHDPPLQFCDARDLAHAVHLALGDEPGLRGAYNVAADGWLTAKEASRLLGRPRLHLPEAVAAALAEVLARFDLLEAGEPWVRYLMHPFVVDTRALRRAGWGATRSNRDIVRQFGHEQRDVWRIGGLRLSRRRLALGAGAATLAGGLAVTGVSWYGYRRWKATR